MDEPPVSPVPMAVRETNWILCYKLVTGSMPTTGAVGVRQLPEKGWSMQKCSLI